jgi:ribosome-binding factor A
MLRVGEQIRHAMAEMLSRGEIHDRLLETQVVSISEVKVSPDLSLATAYVMPLGGGNAKEVVAALEKYKGVFRTRVAARVNLRHAPEIRFKHDETFDKALRMDQLLDSPKVRQDTMKKPEPAAEPATAKPDAGKS